MTNEKKNSQCVFLGEVKGRCMKVQVVQTYNLALSSSLSIAIAKDSHRVPLDGKLDVNTVDSR